MITELQYNEDGSREYVAVLNASECIDYDNQDDVAICRSCGEVYYDIDPETDGAVCLNCGYPAVDGLAVLAEDGRILTLEDD